MKKKIVYILIDAFRCDYISPSITPNIKNYSKKWNYYKKVIPSLTFCERTEIFTGKKPDESNMFLAIGFNPKKSKFKKINFLLQFLHLLDISIFKWKIINKYFRKILNKVFKYFGFGMSVYNIPLNALKYFVLTEDEFSFFDDRSFSSHESIFTICKESGLNIFYDSFTSLNFKKNSDDNSRLQRALDNASKNFDLYLVYIADADTYGHAYGPDSKEQQEVIHRIDAQVADFVDNFKRIYPDSKFIINGDHGMKKVEELVDVKSILERILGDIEAKFGKDVLYFLDSTMFRVWFLDENKKKQIEDSIKENSYLNEKGKFINNELSKKYRIPTNGKLYGDILWIANSGNIICPDFFHYDNAPKGMHGYVPEENADFGMCLVEEGNKSNIIESIHLTEIFEILKNNLKKIR